MPYSPTSLQLDNIINSVKITFKTAANVKGIQITNNISKGVNVYADPNALNTIFTNLVDNAIKYTPKGGKVMLEARAEAN